MDDPGRVSPDSTESTEDPDLPTETDSDSFVEIDLFKVRRMMQVLHHTYGKISMDVMKRCPPDTPSSTSPWYLSNWFCRNKIELINHLDDVQIESHRLVKIIINMSWEMKSCIFTAFSRYMRKLDTRNPYRFFGEDWMPNENQEVFVRVEYKEVAGTVTKIERAIRRSPTREYPELEDGVLEAANLPWYLHCEPADAYLIKGPKTFRWVFFELLDVLKDQRKKLNASHDVNAEERLFLYMRPILKRLVMRYIGTRDLMTGTCPGDTVQALAASIGKVSAELANYRDHCKNISHDKRLTIMDALGHVLFDVLLLQIRFLRRPRHYQRGESQHDYYHRIHSFFCPDINHVHKRWTRKKHRIGHDGILRLRVNGKILIVFDNISAVDTVVTSPVLRTAEYKNKPISVTIRLPGLETTVDSIVRVVANYKDLMDQIMVEQGFQQLVLNYDDSGPGGMATNDQRLDFLGPIERRYVNTILNMIPRERYDSVVEQNLERMLLHYKVLSYGFHRIEDPVLEIMCVAEIQSGEESDEFDQMW